jgi:hypothetical protein
MKDHSWIAKVLINLSAYAEHHGLKKTEAHLTAALAGTLQEVSSQDKRPHLQIVQQNDM